MHDPNVARVTKLVIAQALLLLLLSVIGMIFNWQIARDVFIGGFAATLGSALFALWLFRRSRSVNPNAQVKQVYAGELLKLAVIVVVFGVAIKKVDDLNPVAMLAAFLIVQIVPLTLANKIAR